MGHSAGAQLIALVTTSHELAPELRGATWRGAVLLDSAALDVVARWRGGAVMRWPVASYGVTGCR